MKVELFQQHLVKPKYYTYLRLIPFLKLFRVFFFNEAMTAVVNSGKEVPIAIKDNPITLSDIL